MNPKQIRQSLRMTVEEFATATEVKPHTVRRWEMDPAKDGARSPNRYSAMLIDKLAAAGKTWKGVE